MQGQVEGLMAQFRCIKCDASRFELKLVEPAGASFKYYFVQCASCGGVIGVVEFYNVGHAFSPEMRTYCVQSFAWTRTTYLLR